MANGEQSWSGNFVLLNNTDCPSGWTRATDFDSRFPYGASSYGGTGGTSSHSHSQKEVRTGGTSNINWCQTLDDGQHLNSSHTHSVLITGQAKSALPAYLTTVYCQKTDLDIDAGLIALFDTTVPSGWTRFTVLDSRFPYGSASYGSTGDTSNHNHTVTHGYSGQPSYDVTDCLKYTGAPILGTRLTHVHTWSNGTSGTTGFTPPYRNMIYGSKDSTGVGSPNMISMFTALPPLGWTRFTALDSKFPRGASSYGSTGGNTTHTHSASKTSGGPDILREVTQWTNPNYWYANTTHTHSYSTTLNAGTHIPPYRNTIFGKRNDPVGAGITTTVEFDNSCKPAIDDTTHTITTDCSFSDSRGTDATDKIIYGMDPGTNSTNTSALTVESGTLTITADDHLTVGTITLTDGSISIATDGKITPGGIIYYQDTDADGYPSSTVPQIAITPPANHRRRNLLTSTVTIDCDDNDVNYNTSCE